MKRFVLLILPLLIACQGNLTEATFFVEGNCAACQELIEQSITGHPGLKQAKWDASKSMLSVLYDAEQTDLDQLQEAVAKAGFTTQYFDANPNAREKLPACCRENIEKRQIESPHP